MQSCAQVKVDLASIGPPIVAVNHYRRGWDWCVGREGGREDWSMDNRGVGRCFRGEFYSHDNYDSLHSGEIMHSSLHTQVLISQKHRNMIALSK